MSEKSMCNFFKCWHKILGLLTLFLFFFFLFPHCCVERYRLSDQYSVDCLNIISRNALFLFFHVLQKKEANICGQTLSFVIDKVDNMNSLKDVFENQHQNQPPVGKIHFY